MTAVAFGPIPRLARPPRVARHLALGCLLALAPALHSPLLQDPSDGEDAPTDPPLSRLKSLAEFASALEWERVPAAAQALIELVPHGSDGWFYARQRLVEARYWLWQPELFEVEARETLAVALELRRREPLVRRSSRGSLDPRTAGYVMETQLWLARLLQARGLHHEAIGHLSLLLEDLRSGPSNRWREMMAKVGLESARSLLALARLPEARTALQSLRDNFGDLREGAVAAVTLTAIPGVGDPYRGKYSDDAQHAARRAAVLGALTAARARLAERLGRSVAEMPSPLIGVADTPQYHRDLLAFAEVDPRRPDISPVIVVLAEGVARASYDPVTMLVHELAHLLLSRERGVRYERLPPWLFEGIPQALAGELDKLAWDHLELRLVEDPELFFHRQHWKLRPLALQSESSGPFRSPGHEAPLLMLPLVEDPAGAFEQFLERLMAGAELEQALQDATGLGLEAYESRARVRAQEFLEERRVRSMPGLLALERARHGDPEAAILLSDDMLA